MENETTLYIKLIHVNVRNAQTTLSYIKSQYKTTKPYAQTTLFIIIIIIIIIIFAKKPYFIKELKKEHFSNKPQVQKDGE